MGLEAGQQARAADRAGAHDESTTGSVIVCNGYKDVTATSRRRCWRRRLGRYPLIVVDRFDELET